MGKSAFIKVCMGLARRIIPCLDVTNGRVVKGINFVELRDAGDPVEISRRYDDQGADELTFLDITASSDDRDLILRIIEEVAAQVFIPLTVGGGVRKVEDVRRLLNAGADKVSINTSAVQNPQLVADAAGRYGSQCIVVAIDAKRVENVAGKYSPMGDASHRPGCDRVGKKMQSLGAGEILLTSMDKDGTRNGFDLALTRAVSDAVDVPVIASGGVVICITWWKESCKAMPTRCWRPVFSTMANIHTPGQRSIWRNTALKYGFSENKLDSRKASSLPREPSIRRNDGIQFDFLIIHLFMSDTWLNKVNWSDDGLVPVVTQEADSKEVLMVAWMNREALKLTEETGEAHYWSRSRKKLWHKGEESGHVQKSKGNSSGL